MPNSSIYKVIEIIGSSDVSWDEAAKKAVASGRLRKLAPDEIKGPYFKVYSKRPRFKISKNG